MIQSSSSQIPLNAPQQATHATNTAVPAVDFHESCLGSLPVELLLQVISNISLASDVASVGLTCRALSQIYQDNAIWKFLVLKHFPSAASETTDNEYFSLYQKLTRTTKIGNNVVNGIYDQKVLHGHTGRVSCFKYAKHRVDCLQYADGMLFTGSADGTVRIWDTKTGRCQRVLQGHTGRVCCLQYADGMLFTGSADGMARIWDAKTGECKQVLRGHTDSVYCLQYVDGTLFTGSFDGTARIWDVKTGECKQMLRDHTDSVYCLQYADGMLFTTGSADHTVRIWDAKTSECKHVLQGHEGWVSRLEFAEGMLFTGSYDHTVRIWDVQKGECKQVLRGHALSVNCFQYVDGMLFTGSEDSTVRIWDVQTGECKQVLRGHNAGGHVGGVYCLQYADGMLFTGSEDGAVRIWDTKTGGCQRVLQGHTGSVYCLQYADGMVFITGSLNGPDQAQVWNFNATTDEIFKNIADQLFTNDEEAKARFARMPEQERNKIYWELYKILKPSSHSDLEYGKHAFHDTHGLSCTPQEKARAIHHYIAREIAKLFEGDETQQQLALQKFNQLLPEEIRNKIYYEMYLILQPFPHPSLTAGEDAFQGNPQAGKVATGKNRAEAIKNYLSKWSQ